MNYDFSFYMPVNIIGGNNVLQNNKSVFSQFGKRCLIVTGASSAKKSGALDDVVAILDDETPDTPVEPGTPETPDTPDEPVTPDTPETPDTPDVPENNENTGDNPNGSDADARESVYAYVAMITLVSSAAVFGVVLKKKRRA
jgi:hypothetical protein